MLLEIPDGDLAHITARLADPRVVDAVENLAMAHVEGAHLVTAGRRQLDALTAPALSLRAQRGLAGIRRRASFPSPASPVRILVRFDPQAIFNIIRTTHSLTMEIPILQFHHSSAVRPTRLLCEGEDDLEFLAIVVYEWLTMSALGKDRTLDWSVQAINAAGGNFVNVFAREVRTPLPPVLAIVDSDGGSTGARTAANVLRVDSQTSPGPRRVLVLGGHEIENYLPVGVLREAYRDAPDVLARLEAASLAGQIGTGGSEDLKSMVAEDLLRQALAWLHERGASRATRSPALDLSGRPALRELAAEVCWWGLASAAMRV